MIQDAARPMRNLSVSKIEKALLCGLHFKHKYIDRIPEPRSGVMHAGTVVHSIIEYALKQFAKTGKYPSWQDMDDMFDPAWEAQVKEEEEKPWFLGWEWDADDPEEKVRREYRPLVRFARDEVLPHVRPWVLGTEPVVEHRIDLELDSDIGPFQLIGYIDVLDDQGVLMDWKTSDKVSARQKRLWMQFAAYSIYVWPIVGTEDVQCKKVFLVRGTKPRVEYVPFVITAAHRDFFVKTAAAVWKMVVNGVYLPGTETWLCNPDFCAFFGPCRGEIEKGA